MIELRVEGMHCKSCEMLISDELEENGATNIKIDHKTGKLSFDGLSREKGAEIVEKEGYKVRT